ncbi:MAG TPA: HEPN domain-containing protein [Candidatus Ventrimonas merdavium]|nr:HEPN domain-containing protein [Candidatus Ventrimonas merdavium]
MEGSVKDLSSYRFSCAIDSLEAARILMEAGKYKSAVNRSYYAVFHGLRSVTALDQFDSSKHSGVIAYFNHGYVKNGIFDKTISKLIDTCYRLREKADYQDFFLVSREMAQEQIEKAEKIIQMIEPYLKEQWGLAESDNKMIEGPELEDQKTEVYNP